jgi:hypothetical protein
MMVHFFASLDDDDEVYHAAELLATDCRFLRNDPGASEPTEMFRSAFLVMLIATTHLGEIAAFVDVPGWDMRAMAAGKGGEGVVAIASGAVRRSSLSFFLSSFARADERIDLVGACGNVLLRRHPRRRPRPRRHKNKASAARAPGDGACRARRPRPERVAILGCQLERSYGGVP